MLQTESSAPNRLDMVSRERDLKKEKERGSQGRAGHSKMRPRYDLIVAAQGASPRLPGLRLVVVVKRKKYCGKKAA